MAKTMDQDHAVTARPRSYTYILPRTPKPQLPPRPHTRPSRPKGLPGLGQKLELGSGGAAEEFVDESSACSTPYRLPKIKDDGGEQQPQEGDDLYKVWSRHGYDVYTTKPVELQVLANRMDTTPRQLNQEMRKSHIAANFPKFKEAVISPTHHRPKVFAASTASYHQGFTTRPTTGKTEEAHRLPFVDGDGHSGSPIEQATRCSSPAKSARSIHWALTPYRNTNQDIKSRTRKQGPYSRQFTVHCQAPNNWLKQKFRAKTLPV